MDQRAQPKQKAALELPRKLQVPRRKVTRRADAVDAGAGGV